jgi:hypothetical protein
MADLQDVITRGLITSARQNLINEYIEKGTHRINTSAVYIGGIETISPTRTWVGNLVVSGNISANNLSGINTGDQESSDFNLSDLSDVDDTDKSEGKILKVNSEGKHIYVNDESGTDEKVKYNADDPTAGYIADKFIAGTGIILAEGTGADENKLLISNSMDTSGFVPYTGASANVDLGVNTLTAKSFLFNSETGWFYDGTLKEILMTLSNDINMLGGEKFKYYNGVGGTLNFERELYAYDVFQPYSSDTTIKYGFNFGPESYYHYFLMDNISLRSDTGLNVFGATIDASGNIAGTNLSGTNTGDQVADGVTITGTGTIEDPFVATATPSVNGGVFITNITPQSAGNVSNKVFSSEGYVLDSCQTSTDLVTLSIMAISGNTNYIPEVTVNDSPVTLTGDNSTPLFTGTINIDLNSANSITVIHEDGAEHTVDITYEDTPVISSVEFIGDYPGTQTELKAGDTFSLRIQSTTNFTQIYVYDYGACVEQTETFTATNDKTITATIADRGTTLQSLKGKVKIINSNGTSSADAETNNTLQLNNLYPTVNITTITYPASQGALKDSESATIENGLSNYDSVVYSSGNSQLSITNSTTYESPKTVTRIAGDYNIDTNNLTITATRAANNAVTASSTVVKIAHSSPTIAITLPQARLRSGGNDGTAAQNYVVTLTATQELLQAPTLDLGAEGTWVGAGFVGSGTVWTRSIQVHDDDVKGSYDFNNLIAYNLAGKEVNTINSGATYTLGGFISRVITLNAFANEANMNVAAVTYSKVSMTWSVKSLPNKRAVGTTTVPDVGSWCLHTLETNPAIIRILDTEATSSTSQASTVTIQETV